jgi:light-regulated signal transduction histidine kinase (bacteriophytochrome)
VYSFLKGAYSIVHNISTLFASGANLGHFQRIATDPDKDPDTRERARELFDDNLKRLIQSVETATKEFGLALKTVAGEHDPSIVYLSTSEVELSQLKEHFSGLSHLVGPDSLNIEVGDELLSRSGTVSIDADAIYREIAEFISNSSKYASESLAEGEDLKLQLKLDIDEDDMFTMEFADNGNLTQELGDEILNVDYTTGGTGYGLARARKIIQAHHPEADLEVVVSERDSLYSGLRLRISIPARLEN